MVAPGPAMDWPGGLWTELTRFQAGEIGNSTESPVHLLGESRYRADCTLATAYGCVTTPCNRSTIPRRCAMCKDAQVSLEAGCRL